MESGPKEFCSLESFLSPAFSDVPTTSRLGRDAELRADTLWNNVVAGRQSVVNSRLFDKVRPMWPNLCANILGRFAQHTVLWNSIAASQRIIYIWIVPGLTTDRRLSGVAESMCATRMR